jgi:hypothetical protein
MCALSKTFIPTKAYRGRAERRDPALPAALPRFHHAKAAERRKSAAHGASRG